MTKQLCQHIGSEKIKGQIELVFSHISLNVLYHLFQCIGKLNCHEIWMNWKFLFFENIWPTRFGDLAGQMGRNMDQMNLLEFAEESKEKSLFKWKISNLIRQNLGEPNFWHQLGKHFWSVSYFPIHFTQKYFEFHLTKYFGGQNCRWTKHYVWQHFQQYFTFSAVLSTKIFSEKVF